MATVYVEVPEAGAWLTDGKRLVNVLGPAEQPGGVEVEDAVTEEVQVLGADVIQKGWKRVKPRD